MKNYKIAVLSDIHSNITAFSACMKDIEKRGVDLIVFLGDNVSDYPEPELTFNFIYEIKEKYPTLFVKGNREDYLLNPKDYWKPSSKNGSLYHSMKHLRPKDIEFMQSMPLSQVIELEGTDSIIIAHGTPIDCYEGLYINETKTKEYFNQFDEKVLLVGHTHTPFILKENDKMIINPGSVGSSVNGDIRSQYLLLEWQDDHWLPTHQFISYDYHLEQQRCIDTKYYDDAFYWAAACFKNLETGINEALNLLIKANEIAGNNNIPTEEQFAEAAKFLNIPKI